MKRIQGTVSAILLLLALSVSAATNTIYNQTLEPNPATADELMIDKAADGPTRKITIGSIISGQTEVTAVGADYIAIIDVTDSTLRKATLSDLLITPAVVGNLSIQQDAAQNVLTLDQNATAAGSSFVDFQGTEAANVTGPISTHQTAGTISKWLQIEINGAKLWIAVYGDPSP